MPRLAPALLACALPAAALAVPMQFAHQGRLLDADGGVISGTRDLRFRLYDAAVDGGVVWEESHPGVPVTDGYYAVVLGTSTTLDTAVLDGSARYLAVKVGADPELPARTALLTVPYAARAAVADNAGDLSIFDGITRSCPNGALQTFDGDTATWSACPVDWSCAANPTHAGCPGAPASSDYASCGAIYDDPGFVGTNQDGEYWIDPDGPGGGDAPFKAWCLMSTAGGGWTQVWNVDTGDAHYVPFDNTSFWTTTGTSQGTNAAHYTADYKSAVVHADLVGSELLILAHNEGTQLAWRAWTLATARTPAELTAVATNSTVTGAILGSSNTANLDTYEAVVRPGGQIRANWRYGYTTSYDEARFVNDAAPALSSANNGDDTVAGIGTWMNINGGGGPGSRWDAGYGWDGAGYQKALMGSDEVAGDSWGTTNSRGLHYDYAIFIR